MPDITIKLNSPVAIYEQIVQNIEQQLQHGQLKTGSLLPTIRQLAQDLEINPNTVARAYRILESKHIIQTARRRGTYITDKAELTLSNSIEKDAYERALSLSKELVARGLSITKLKNIFLDTLTKI